jgi:hypothetical protein
MIGDEFHPAAIAVFAKIGALLGEVGEQAFALGNGVAVAAGVDDQIAVLGLCSGPTEGAV